MDGSALAAAAMIGGLSTRASLERSGDGSALADTAINPFERLKFWQAMQLKEILTMKTATTLQVV